MKKLKTLLLALCLAGATAATAQRMENPYIGIRASFEETTSTQSTHVAKFGSGFSAGVTYIAPFANHFYGQGSVLFSKSTIGIDGVNNLKYNPKHYEGNVETMGLDVPINLGWRFLETSAVRLMLYTGPHFFIVMSNKAKYDIKWDGFVDPIDTKLDVKTFDIGWGVGLGADFLHHWHVQVEGIWGLKDLTRIDLAEREDGSPLRRASVSVGIGYNF